MTDAIRPVSTVLGVSNVPQHVSVDKHRTELSNVRRVIVLDAGPIAAAQYSVTADTFRRLLGLLLPAEPSRDTGEAIVPQSILTRAALILSEVPATAIMPSKAATVAALLARAGCPTTEIHLSDGTYDDVLAAVNEPQPQRIGISAPGMIRRGILVFCPELQYRRLEFVTGVARPAPAVLQLISRTLEEQMGADTNVLLSGWVAAARPAEWIRNLIRLCRRAGAHFLVDSRSYRHSSEGVPDVLKINLAEARSAFDRPLEDIAQVVRLMAACSYPLLMITMGRYGALASIDRQLFLLHREAIEVNPVGAGDSAMAVLAAEFGSGPALLEIVRRATLAASQNVETADEGGLPRLEQLAEVNVTSLRWDILPQDLDIDLPR